MKQYRAKNFVVQALDFLKNTHLSELFDVEGEFYVKGPLFLTFIAAILRSAFNQKLSSTHARDEDLNVQDCLEQLFKMECISYDDAWLIKQAPTRTMKKILAKLGLSQQFKNLR